MSNRYFTVYSHNFVTENHELLNRQFIVLKQENGTLRFTNFHEYVKSPTNRIVNVRSNGNKRFCYVTKFLNYAFFYAGISKLNDITIDIVEDFLNDYGLCSLPDDNEHTRRAESTVKMCVSTIMDFMTMFIEDKTTKTHLRTDDLYKIVNKRDKKGKITKVKVPRFDVNYKGSKKTIFRDIPNNAFDIIFEHVVTHHPEILALVSLSAFAGLRPSEACNVRRTDSPLGPGILFDVVNGETRRAFIDLREEMNLRSDLISVGRIKKERKQEVPDIFLNAFVESYNIYMDYLKGKKYEKDYAPLSINNQGKAMTYERYRQIFQTMIQEEIIPIFLRSNNQELVIYGRTLMEHKISPHIFRHWYTVQLVLSGVNEPGTLMYFRGDRSPESALTYLQNKGELEKMYRKVSSNVFDYLIWAAGKRYDGT